MSKIDENTRMPSDHKTEGQEGAADHKTEGQEGAADHKTEGQEGAAAMSTSKDTKPVEDGQKNGQRDTAKPVESDNIPPPICCII